MSDGYYKFVNRHSGLVLDVTGAFTTTNTPFEQWGDNGGNNQQFQLIAQTNKSKDAKRRRGNVTALFNL